MSRKNIPEIENLSELIGEFIEYWGFKKVHGRLWLHLYLSDCPLDAKDLMKRLNISKALVSISLKDLLAYDVIIETEGFKSGSRTYEANKDIKTVIERVLRGREKILIAKIKGSFHNLKSVSTKDMKDQNLKASSLKDLEKLISNGDKMLNALISLI